MSPSSEISAFPPDESPKASKFCAETGKPFALGEKIHSILFESDGEIRRRDYSVAGWKAATKPEGVIAEWTTTNSAAAPDVGEAEALAPNDALAALFDALADKPEKADLRYALALLLTRRRVLRYEYDDSRGEEDGSPDAIYVYSSRNDVGSLVPVVPMDEARALRVQEELETLLNDPNGALARELAGSNFSRVGFEGRLFDDGEDLSIAAALAAQALEDASADERDDGRAGEGASTENDVAETPESGNEEGVETGEN